MAKPERVPSMERIYAFLDSLGATADYKGYIQTAYAIFIALSDPECLTLSTKLLYPDVAKYYHTSGSAVERNIRTLISRIWEINPQKVSELSRPPLQGKPSPTRFIALCRAYLVQERAGTEPAPRKNAM